MWLVDVQVYYCWCPKSCITKDDDYPIIYRVLTIPGGCLGFLPSTVSLLVFGGDLIYLEKVILTFQPSTTWCFQRLSQIGSFPQVPDWFKKKTTGNQPARYKSLSDPPQKKGTIFPYEGVNFPTGGARSNSKTPPVLNGAYHQIHANDITTSWKQGRNSTKWSCVKVETSF